MHWMAFITYTFTAIFPIVNPIGMAPVFLTLTKHMDSKTRHRMALNISLYFFFLCAGFMIFGKFILEFFGLTVPYIKIAGGFLVFYSAWEMLNGAPKLNTNEESESQDKQEDISFFPLTMPITAGAGTLAMSMAIGMKISSSSWHDSMMLHIGAVLGVILITLSVYLCYRFADVIFLKLGHIGTNIVSKLSAFILLAISVEIIVSGFVHLIGLR